MNNEEAQAAMDNKTPVVDTYTGAIGVIEQLKPDHSAMVLYFGQRLARLTKTDDLELVALRGYTPSGRPVSLPNMEGTDGK